MGSGLIFITFYLNCFLWEKTLFRKETSISYRPASPWKYVNALNLSHAKYFKMSRPLLIFSQSVCLIQVVDANLDTKWQTAQIQIFRSQLIWIYIVCKDRVYPVSAGLGLGKSYWWHSSADVVNKCLPLAVWLLLGVIQSFFFLCSSSRLNAQTFCWIWACGQSRSCFVCFFHSDTHVFSAQWRSHNCQCLERVWFAWITGLLDQMQYLQKFTE